MKRILSALLLSLCANLPANDITSWTSPPEVISTSGVNASDAHVKMDSSGNVVAIWLENGTVVSKSHLLNADWGSLSTVSSSGASDLQLVVDPAGNATAMWVLGGVIQTSTMPFGGSWGSVTSLSASGSSSPDIAVDATGNLIAVWVTSGVVESSKQPFGSSWSAATAISGSNSSSPEVYIGADGTIVAVWQSLNGITSIYNINAATTTIAGSWSSSSIVSNPALNSVNPSVAVDVNGSGVALWYSYTPSGGSFANVIVQTSTLPLSGSWSTPIALSTAGFIIDPNILSARIKIGSDDAAMAIWTQSYDGITFTIESAVSDNKINWSQAYTINNSLYCYEADMGISSNDEVFGLYMYYDGVSTIMINSIESTLNSYSNPYWTNPIMISQGTNNAFPRIAVGITGGTNCNATAVWLNYDGTNTTVNSSFGTGTVVLPPTSLSVIQNVNDFGVFQEYYNTISWTASTSPNLNGYVVYQNGVQIAFVSTPSVSFIDHNAVQSGPVTYGVTAYDDTGTQSAVATISYP